MKKTNVSKVISKVIVYALAATFILGCVLADSLMESGKPWLLCIMLFMPFIVAIPMNKAGMLDWLGEKWID